MPKFEVEPSALVAQLGGPQGVIEQRVEAIAGAQVRIGGHWLLNFVSTHYLDLAQHPAVIRALRQDVATYGLSLGLPRILGAPALVSHLESTLAVLVGQQAALLFPSTTHAALDVIPALAGPHGRLFLDELAYPISAQGARAAMGVQIVPWTHNSVAALAQALSQTPGYGRRAVICDGVYIAGGQAAPLGAIAQIAARCAAWLYVDDAHGLGVLGAEPSPAVPYGHGGGGSLHFVGARAIRTVYVASLAKAFGVPLAFAAGPEDFIAHLRAAGSAYTHSSPPLLSLVAAAQAALAVHAVEGETRRAQLLHAVRRFRGIMHRAGLPLANQTNFPIQTVLLPSPQAAATVACRLRRCGVWVVPDLLPPEHHGGALRFVFSSAHSDEDIDRLVAALEHCLRSASGLVTASACDDVTA